MNKTFGKLVGAWLIAAMNEQVYGRPRRRNKPTKTYKSSWSSPHQGNKEKARRLRQMQQGLLVGLGINKI